MIQSATSDTFGFDCSGLIKGVLWGWNGDKGKTYGGARYASCGVPDLSADAMIARCSGVSTDFSNIHVGEVVWLSGHIGVYVGGGKVVESTPSWKNCVQITALSARKWVKHGKLPYVNYSTSKSVTDIAKEVIAGKWGNGAERKRRLTVAGYDYAAVQNMVNKLL